MGAFCVHENVKKEMRRPVDAENITRYDQLFFLWGQSVAKTQLSSSQSSSQPRVLGMVETNIPFSCMF